MLPLLLTFASWLDDIDKKIDEVFKGRTDRVVGELTDEILHEVGHTRRLRAARAAGTLDARTEAAKKAAPEALMRESGKTLEPDTLWAELRKVPVVHLAETHDQPRHHEIQLEAIRQLDTGKGDLAVGFEMFPRDLQPILDQWNAGELSEWEFMEGVNWYKSWGFPYPLFRPIFKYCIDHDIKLVALNAPPDINRLVGRGGLKSLTPEQRARLPKQIVLNDAAHRRNFEEILPHHPGINVGTFYEAFCVWDESMADSAAAWLKKNGGRLVVIAGNGHIKGRLGIPERLNRRTNLPYRILLTQDVRDPDENFDLMLDPGADFVWWTKEAHQPAPPRLGIGLDETLKITMVAPDSAAEKAGVKVGDVLKKAGKRIMKQPESIRHFMELRKSDKFTLTVERDGKKVEVSVTLARTP
ncbi:MAG: ChaN family lipoprotein [Planctomycetes bacterium]|nr:ChaN family lipoprotein [Planctomycetota bacterium]